MPRAKAEQPADADGELDFDARVSRLEALVREMEQGGLGLEGSIRRYEEGVELLRRCREELASYRKQVEELGDAGELDELEGDPDLEDEG